MEKISKILITGASKGLGREAAFWFAKKKYKLVLAGRNQNDLIKLIEKLPHKNLHTYLKIDLQKPSNLSQINVQNKIFKGLRIIIHCAGGGLGLKNPLLSNSDFNDLLNLNFLSSVEINRKFYPILKNKNSKIIHIGSIASYEAVGSVGYNCSKSIISAYVKSLGKILIKDKIIITGIMPGGFIGYKNAMWRLKKKNFNAYNNFIKTRLPAKKMFKSKDLMPILNTLCTQNIDMLAGNMIAMDAGEGVSYNS